MIAAGRQQRMDEKDQFAADPWPSGNAFAHLCPKFELLAARRQS